MIRILSMLLVTVSVPLVTYAQSAVWLNSVSGGFSSIIKSAVVLLTGIALALFIWGLVVFIKNSGDEKAHEEGRRKMVWGIVALFVIVSVWGLVVLLQDITGIGSGTVVAPRSSM